MGTAPRIFSSAWSAYSNALRSHPLTTNIVTSGCITVASDTIAQTVSRGEECKPFPHYLDPKRSLTMLGWGTAVSGFGMFHWFRFLERLIPSENITPGKIAAKVLINQVNHQSPCAHSLTCSSSCPAAFLVRFFPSSLPFLALIPSQFPSLADRLGSHLKRRVLRRIDGQTSRSRNGRGEEGVIEGSQALLLLLTGA
eukprot:763352-Hanusia_phi.AAC.1